jgi:hypothetical protein
MKLDDLIITEPEKGNKIILSNGKKPSTYSENPDSYNEKVWCSPVIEDRESQLWLMGDKEIQRFFGIATPSVPNDQTELYAKVMESLETNNREHGLKNTSQDLKKWTNLRAYQIFEKK